MHLSQQAPAVAHRIDQINELNARAWSIFKEQRQEARKLSKEAIELATTGPFVRDVYKQGVAESLRTLSRLNLYDGNYEHSLSQALEALKILEDENIPELMGDVLYSVATCFMTLGNLSEGLDFYLRQLELCESLDDKEGTAMALLGIGSLYSELEDYASALSYTEQSLKIFEELQLHYWNALVLNNICYYHFLQGEFNKALEWGHRSLEFCRRHPNPRIEGVLSNSIAEIYISLNQPDEALTYLETSGKLAQQTQDPDMAIESLKLSGQVYLKKGQPEEALPFIKESLALAEKTHFKRWLHENHFLLSEIYRGIGQYKDALLHYEQFHDLKEAFQSEAITEKLKNLEIIQRTQVAQREAELYASLYKEEQARRTLAETMQRVGSALTGSIELEAVLDTILAELAQLVTYDRASVLIKRRNELEIVAMRGFPESEQMLNRKVLLDAGQDSQDVFLRIYHSKKPLALENLEDYDGWQQISELPIPGAWLGLPLIHRNEVRGMLSLVRSKNIPYDDEAIALATAFAATAVVALENARSYNRSRRFNDQLEYEVRQRTQALQDAYVQLERLDRTKADFIAVTAHELRTPITVIKAYSQLMQKKNRDENGDAIDDSVVKGIVSGANRLHDIVNTMLWMVKIDASALEFYPEPLSMMELVSNIIKELTNDIAQRNQRVSLDEGIVNLPPIMGDGEALKVVFANIIVNAIKYTPDGGEIRIHGRAWDEPPNPDLPSDAVMISVSDSGIGIAPDLLDLIFTKFYQTGDVAYHSSGKTKYKGGGPGLGLAIARGIIEAHHGRLWAESEGHDEQKFPGSDFHIVLPRSQPAVEAKPAA